jgi:hypothetical protein
MTTTTPASRQLAALQKRNDRRAIIEKYWALSNTDNDKPADYQTQIKEHVINILDSRRVPLGADFKKGTVTLPYHNKYMSVFKLLVDFENNEITILRKRGEIHEPFNFRNVYTLDEAALAAAKNVFSPLHNGATQFKVTVDFQRRDGYVEVRTNSNAGERRDARVQAPFTDGCV